MTDNSQTAHEAAMQAARRALVGTDGHADKRGQAACRAYHEHMLAHLRPAIEAQAREAALREAAAVCQAKRGLSQEHRGVTKEVTISKAELVSDVAQQAFQIADYRLRHNTRYRDWSEEKRLAYRLELAFNAVVEARNMGEIALQVGQVWKPKRGRERHIEGFVHGLVIVAPHIKGMGCMWPETLRTWITCTGAVLREKSP